MAGMGLGEAMSPFGNPFADAAAGMRRAFDEPLPPGQHPCKGCGAWFVAANKIRHFREDCGEYPQESGCR